MEPEDYEVIVVTAYLDGKVTWEYPDGTIRIIKQSEE
jgi:hypothetical protein